MPKTRELSLQRKDFCRHLVANGFNATLAAKLAKYKGNHATLAATGSRLLRIDKVQAEINRLLADIEELSTVEVEEIVQELRKLAFNRAVLLSNTDKLRALELLGRYKAMFTDKYQDTSRTDQQRQLTELEQAEARRLAAIRLQEGA